MSAFSYMAADCEDEERLRTLCEDLFCECLDPSMCSVSLVERYIRELFVLLMRSPSSYGTQAQDEAGDVVAILRYIDTHYADCTLQELSDMFLLSPSYISSLIKQKTGKWFTDILKESRIKTARFYLRCSDLPISDISSLCGYTNRAFFYRPSMTYAA